MPFCSSCGNTVNPTDQFCAKCGARQPIAGPHPVDPLAGITPRTASILCYIPGIGWIASVIVLAADKFRNNHVVRFHAFQGLYLFVAWLIVDWVVSPALLLGGMGIGHAFRPLGGLLHLCILAAWIVMLIKVSHSEHYRLPIIGEMADRSVREQGV